MAGGGDCPQSFIFLIKKNERPKNSIYCICLREKKIFFIGTLPTIIMSILGLTNTMTYNNARRKYLRAALIHHPNRGGSTATFQNIQNEWERWLNRYQRRGRNPTTSRGQTAPRNTRERRTHTQVLLSSILSGSLDSVRQVITQYGTGVINNPTGTSGMYPLHHAATNGYLNIVQFLLNKGARPNTRTRLGQTPLHFASIGGHLSVVRLLISKRAYINAMDKDDKTPIHYAAENGHSSIVRFLIERRVNVNQMDNFTKTPLHYAAQNNHINVASILLRSGARVNIQDRYGQTPLSTARTNVMKTLLRRYGAEIPRGQPPRRQQSRRVYKDANMDRTRTVQKRLLHDDANGIDLMNFTKIPYSNARVILGHEVGGKIRYVFHKDFLEQLRELKNPYTRQVFSPEDVVSLDMALNARHRNKYRNLPGQ